MGYRKWEHKSLRLERYDYSSEGSYFVTGVTRNRECVLGEVRENLTVLSAIGEVVLRCWLELPSVFPNVSLDEFQIMPDHFHGIVVLWKNRGNLINQIATDSDEIPTGIDADSFGPQTNWPLMKNPKPVLGKVLRHFKAKATKTIHDDHDPFFGWQGRFHDRIIRDEAELDRIRQYIRDNPLHWGIDREKGGIR